MDGLLPSSSSAAAVARLSRQLLMYCDGYVLESLSSSLLDLAINSSCTIVVFCCPSFDHVQWSSQMDMYFDGLLSSSAARLGRQLITYDCRLLRLPAARLSRQSSFAARLSKRYREIWVPGLGADVECFSKRKYILCEYLD